MTGIQHVVLAGSGSLAVHIAAILGQWGLGYEFFQYTGLLLAWELLYGWSTLSVVLFVVMYIPKWLRRHSASRRDDRGQAAMDPTWVIAGIVLVLVLLVGGQVMAAATSGEAQEYAEDAEAYCEQELGEDAHLVNSHVIGEHGGLHCEGPDGEFIHLHDVPRDEIAAANEELE